MSASSVRSAQRTGCAVALYRSLLNLALLIVAFRSFPEHQGLIALAVIVFSQGIGAIGVTARLFFAEQNRIDDLAERKTRHTILLAAAGRQDDYDFWIEVDRRVAEENINSTKPSPWWAQIGLTAMTFVVYLVGDLISVAIAAVIAG